MWLRLSQNDAGGGRMKKGITFYIDDDVDMIAFCGTLCTQTKDTDEPIRGVTMLNLTVDSITKCSEWYVPVKGKAEPYQSEIPTGAEGENE